MIMVTSATGTMFLSALLGVGNSKKVSETAGSLTNTDPDGMWVQR
jgi:hypothetical protein